jgi:hypothetical protein
VDRFVGDMLTTTQLSYTYAAGKGCPAASIQEAESVASVGTTRLDRVRLGAAEHFGSFSSMAHRCTARRGSAGSISRGVRRDATGCRPGPRRCHSIMALRRVR